MGLDPFMFWIRVNSGPYSTHYPFFFSFFFGIFSYKILDEILEHITKNLDNRILPKLNYA